MSAWKVEGDKDRRTRMATSSINQPMKKGGAGAFTWGSAMDVKDYEPVGANVTKISTAPVITMAAPVVTTTPTAMNVCISDSQAFPTLGAAPAAPVVSTSWGPSVQASSISIAQAATVRSGVEFDASHPRNTFARKPHVSTAPVVTEVVAQPAIDWSGTGVTTLQRQVIQSTNNAAHLNPYQTVQTAQPLTMDQLRASSVMGAGYPKAPKQVFKQAPRVIMQPRGR